MKRLLVLAALMILCMAPSLDSTAYKCILTNTCKPLPCEFMYELKMARAREYAIFQARAGNTTDFKAFSRHFDEVFDALKKASRKYSKCAPYTPPRQLGVVGSAPACEIGVWQTPVSSNMPTTSLEDELRAASTCSELVEAEYARAQLEQSHCQNGLVGATLANYKARKHGEESRRLDSLESNLLRYLSSCKPDANTSRHIAEAGLDALAKAGRNARMGWQVKKKVAARFGGAR